MTRRGSRLGIVRLRLRCTSFLRIYCLLFQPQSRMQQITTTAEEEAQYYKTFLSLLVPPCQGCVVAKEEEEEGSFDSKSGRHYTLVCSFRGSLAGTTTTMVRNVARGPLPRRTIFCTHVLFTCVLLPQYYYYSILFSSVTMKYFSEVPSPSPRAASFQGCLHLVSNRKRETIGEIIIVPPSPPNAFVL